MFLTVLFLTLSVSAHRAYELSDVSKKCLEVNNATVSSDYLVGTWYHIYQFSWSADFPASCYCERYYFKKPSDATIAAYKAKYNEPDLPYSFDDDPVLTKNSYWQGMVTGKTGAKFYVLSPKSPAKMSDGYEVMVYKPLSDKFMIKARCAMRGHMLEMLSRDRNATVEEMEEIIKKTPEFDRLERQRYCVVDKHCVY